MDSSMCYTPVSQFPVEFPKPLTLLPITIVKDTRSLTEKYLMKWRPEWLEARKAEEAAAAAAAAATEEGEASEADASYSLQTDSA